MRVLPLLVVATCMLSGCTTITVGDTSVWGRTKDVSREDIRAAIAIGAADPYSHGKAPEAQVINRDQMERMAQHTKQPEVLHELFEALGSDPFVIAECLARPVLVERTLATVASVKESWVATSSS